MKVEVVTNQSKASLFITDHIEKSVYGNENVEYGYHGSTGMEIEVREMLKLSDEAWVSIKHWVEDKHREILDNEAKRRSQAFEALTGSMLSTKKPKEFTRTKTQGYVYLLGADNGLFKIGKSKNVNARLADLNKQSPVSIEILHSFASEDYTTAEKELHKRYKNKRKVGEWFLLSDQDVENIRGIGDFQL